VGIVATRRHALGWPQGSIRALLALLVVGLVCALMLIPPHDPNQPTPIPAYLLYLMALILGHYFAARGQAETAGPHPLWLPRGSVRLLLLGSLTAAGIYHFVTEPDIFRRQLELSVQSLQTFPMLPVIIQGAFFLGVLVRMAVGKSPPVWFQDFEAWIALIAVMLLATAVLIHLVIAPTVTIEIDLGFWQGLLAAVVAFYFGERS
jgi:hypothetical protein